MKKKFKKKKKNDDFFTCFSTRYNVFAVNLPKMAKKCIKKKDTR